MNTMTLLPLLFGGCLGEPEQTHIVWGEDLASHQVVIDYDYSVAYGGGSLAFEARKVGQVQSDSNCPDGLLSVRQIKNFETRATVIGFDSFNTWPMIAPDKFEYGDTECVEYRRITGLQTQRQSQKFTSIFVM